MPDMPTLEDWKSRISKLDIHNRAFINGRYVDAVSGKTMSCISPIDGKSITEVAECDAEDVNLAVQSARAAFEKGLWSNMAPRKRKRVLQKFAEKIKSNMQELALLETLDMGKPITYSLTHDMLSVVQTFRWFAEAIDKVYDEIAPMGSKELGLITREPIGVIGAVVPWNFPLDMATLKIAPALAAGNSVVLKPAEQSPLTALRIAELAVESGLPEGVLNVVPGFGPTAGQALGRHMDVDMLSFTGSTEVGKLFLKYSGESNMKQVALECGGKSPNIIMADVENLDAAAIDAAANIFYNSGQVCTAASRLLLDESIHDEFLEKVMAEAIALKIGDPLDPSTEMGTMVDLRQTERVLDYINIGQEEGAELSHGGKRIGDGCYLEPTVFQNVQSGMRIAQEEIFGPVLSVLTFSGIDEALKLANDSQYGLQAGIWTSNLNTAHRFVRELRAGMVTVNSWSSYHPVMPFGGVKQSGFGRDFSLHGLQKYTQMKSTYFAF